MTQVAEVTPVQKSKKSFTPEQAKKAEAEFSKTRQELRKRIGLISEQIFKIKQNATIIEKDNKFCFLKEGKPLPPNATDLEKKDKSVKWGMHPYDKIISSINPKHPDWRIYKDLKRQASFYLTCLRILKHFKDTVPTKKEFSEACRGGYKQGAKFSQHSKKGYMAMSAFRYLQKLWNRVEKGQAK